MVQLSSPSNMCDCRTWYMISDHSSDSKGIIGGWQTDLEVRTRWKWRTLWRRDSTQHFTCSLPALIKAWSSAGTTQQTHRNMEESERQRVRYKTPSQAAQCLFLFTAVLTHTHTQSFCIILPLAPGPELALLALDPVLFVTNCINGYSTAVGC